MALKDILLNLPEIAGPTQKKLGFQEKLKWTLRILVLFFVMGIIPLFGLGDNALAQFEYLSIILGAEFGSIISLGIGPLVTASIVIQLLNGAGILNFDLKSPDGKRMFQETEKIDGYIAEKASPNYIKGYPFRALFIVLPLEKYLDKLTTEEHAKYNHREKALSRLWEKIVFMYNK